jgi:hypothetical protein
LPWYRNLQQCVLYLQAANTAVMEVLSSNTPASIPETFDFQRLLPELQDLIWEAALPEPRVFHVRRTFGPWNGSSTFAGTDFHISHPPPALLWVCKSSRAIAHRKGIYLGRKADTWFNPERDILYFDKSGKNQCLPRLTGPPTLMPVHNWDKIRNVGIEWRAFFYKTPRPQSTRDMRAMWRAIIRLLQMYLPGMRRLHYVLPMVRHRGGLAWGREPYGSQQYEIELAPLAEEIKVPWGDALILDDTMPTLPAGGAQAMAELLSLGRNKMIPWGVIKKDIECAIDENVEKVYEEEEGDWMIGVKKQRDLPMPEIVGRWLMRPDTH